MSGSAIRDVSRDDAFATDALRERLQRLKQALAQHDVAARPATIEGKSDASSEGRMGEEGASAMVLAEKAPVASAAEVPEPGEQASRPVPRQEPGVREQRAEAAQTARMLLGMVSQPPSVISLQEKQLAQDLLAVLLCGGELRQEKELCAQVAQRLCHMRPPPQALLWAVLDCVGAEEKQQLGERLHVGEEILLPLLEQADAAMLAGIVRRRHVPGVVAQRLVKKVPDSLMPRLLENEGVVLTEAGWRQLLCRVAENPKLASFLLGRSDMPRHVAMELFWHLQPRQRKLFLLRRVGESQQLKRLLELAMPRAAMERVGKEFLAQFHVMLGLLAEGDRQGAAALLARHCGLHEDTIGRILRDVHGEPLGVLFKACGTNSASLREVIRSMQAHRKAHRWPWLENPDQVLEVHSVLGVSQARMMILYWDWRSRATGPYRGFSSSVER